MTCCVFIFRYLKSKRQIPLRSIVDSRSYELDKSNNNAKAKERIAELDGLMQSVYEDKVSGEIPASMCAKLLSKYEAEQNALSAEVQEIEARQLMQKQDEHDVDEYISRLKRFRNAEYLTRQMCLELIDSVTVDEFERGKQERDIHIYYKFIDKGYTGKSDD